MLLAYLDAATHRALDEPLEDDDGWFVAIHEFPGVWASGKTVEEAREQLRSALGGWIIRARRQGEQVPTVNGINLAYGRCSGTSTPPSPVASVVDDYRDGRGSVPAMRTANRSSRPWGPSPAASD